jgi:hypothetical protein
MIKSKISPLYSDSVSFEHEVDCFMDVLAAALNSLQYGILERLESGFRTMSSVNWGTITTVGEESAHLYQWQRILQECLPKIREALNETYYKTFCTKLATLFLARYLDVILRQKRISEIGTQQLLLDTYNVKTLLLHFHHMGLASSTSSSDSPSTLSTASLSSSSIPPMYMKLITSKISQIEVILKLIGTPEEMIVERFQIMWPEGTLTDLQLIMSLAGVSKVQQQQYLEAYGLATGTSTTQASGGGSTGGVLPGVSRLPIPIPLPPLSSASATVNTANATVNSVANSVRSLTQDISSTARSAVGDLRKGFLR